MSRFKLCILDRDGVINEDSPDYVKSEEECVPIPGSIDAIRTLKLRGTSVGIATNQSGIGRGLFGITELEKMHRKLFGSLWESGLGPDWIEWCPHHPDDSCSCRKPKPGMLKKILVKAGCSPSEAVFIGDSLRDIEAAESAGVVACLVLTGNGIDTAARLPKASSAIVFNDLSSAVKWMG